MGEDEAALAFFQNLFRTIFAFALLATGAGALFTNMKHAHEINLACIEAGKSWIAGDCVDVGQAQSKIEGSDK